MSSSAKTILIAHRLPGVRDRFAAALADARHAFVTADNEAGARRAAANHEVPISLALVERLLKAYPAQTAGMKDSGGDWSNTKAFLDAFAGAGFDVFAGSETFLLQNMRHGGRGCISATANVHPGPIARLHDTWQGPDADAQQARLDEIRNTFQKFPMIPALKAAIAHYGRDAAWSAVRPPLVALAPEQAAALVTELDQRRFTMPGLAR